MNHALVEVDELAVEEGVPGAGGHLVDGRALGVGPLGGHGDDRGDHEVDRDDVDDPSGTPGNWRRRPRA